MKNKRVCVLGVFLAVAFICEFGGGASVWASVPSLTNDAPAPGKRVRITAPEYVGTGVYHALYLPVDWTPGGSYPVIVEYAPNLWSPFSGTVEDTHLGYYQSAGAGCIWVSMPCINYTTNPDTEALTWWGNGNVDDPTGESLTAEYTKTNLIRILEDFAGDNSAVFVTGFSRGAIACGYIALRDPAMADIWLGFMPHSHHDGGTFTPDSGNVRLSRVSGRASFITYGEVDSGKSNSITGVNILTGLGFPVESREIPGTDHTDEWIVDTASASSLSVRAEMRTWLTDTIANKPGTHSISGQVTSGGSPVDGARVQSGETHWTFTDTNGNFTLDGLIDGDRIVMAAWGGYESENQSVTLSGMDLTGVDLVLDQVVDDLAKVLALGDLTAAPAMWEGDTVSSPVATVSPGETTKAVYFDALDYKGNPTRVFAYVGIPAGATSANPVPCAISIHGGGGDASVTQVTNWTDRGYAAISLAVEGQHSAMPGPARVGIYGDSGGTLGDQWMYHAVADAVLANSLMGSLPEVDATKVGVMGWSWGGVICSTVMGIDTRLAFSIPVNGCGHLYDSRNHWGNALYNNDVYKHLWDPMIRMHRATMPAMWYSWEADYHFSLDNQAETYHAAPGERMVTLVPNIGHAAYNMDDCYAFTESIFNEGSPWCTQESLTLNGNTAEVVFRSTKTLTESKLVSATGTGHSRDLTWVVTSAALADNGDGTWTATAVLPAGTTGWFVNVMSADLVVSSDYQENNTLTPDPSEGLVLRDPMDSDVLTGSFTVDFSGPTSVRVSDIYFSEETHAGALSVLSGFPFDIGYPLPPVPDPMPDPMPPLLPGSIEIQFDNAVAGLSYAESASAKVIVAWDKLDGSTDQIELPVTILRADPDTTLPLGDFDGSGEVEMGDLRMLAEDWLKDETVPDTLVTNLNGDTIVNLQDYAIMASNWLATAPNQAPTFTSDPIIGINADKNVAYNSSIADDASDPEDDPMTFSKVSGPAWLTVAETGTLSGTPGPDDTGPNTWSVQVSDNNGGTDVAALYITVNTDGTDQYALVQWGQRDGQTDILTARIDGNGLTFNVYNPVVAASPSDSGYYPAPASDSRTPRFYAAGQRSTWAMEIHDQTESASIAGDYIGAYDRIAAGTTNQSMVVWQSADFMAADGDVAGFNAQLANRNATDRGDLYWLVEKNGSWYISELAGQFDSMSTTTITTADASALTWYDFTPFGLDGNAPGVATIGSSPVTITMGGMTSAGYFFETENTATSDKWSGSNVSYFSVTATGL